MNDNFRIILDLDPAATPIAGSLEACGNRTGFQGLLELVSLLERLRDVARSQRVGEEQTKNQ
jgi:hypothetical protein